MRLEVLSAILILLLTFVPVCTIPTGALVEIHAKSANSDPEVRVQTVGNVKRENWDFEKANEWSEFVCMNNDSVELVLGIGNSDKTAIGKLKTIIEKFHGKIINDVWMKGVLNSIVVDMPLQFVSSFTNDLRDSELVGYVEPNLKYQIHSVPNDPLWNLQWGPQKIGVDWAWNITTGGREILVAIVDTGIDWNHTDLAANYVPLGYDWVHNDTDPMDDNGHGTHAAGIVAAVLNNGVGIAGIAQVRIMTEKGIYASGSGSEVDLANGIIHAVEQNATIISMSWGANADSSLIHEAIKFAYDSGVLLVASAGNAAGDYKSFPAAYDEVIAVSATDQQDRPAFFTNFGDWVEVAAPGVQIYSTVLSNNYAYKSGTSMAAPHVAGVAALIWSIFPNMTRDQVRYHLRYTADDLGADGFDAYYGYGRINATRAVNRSLPETDILMKSLEHPHYIELNSTGILNATILNYGAEDESNITVEFLSNKTLVSSETIDFLKSGLTALVNFTWTPPTEGLYNININILPVPNETMEEDNFIEAIVYGGTPIKVHVIRSSGTYFSWTTATWEALDERWFEFGNAPVFIDFATLDRGNITHEDLEKSGSDVLIVSAAYFQDFGWEFGDSEIEAITEYVYEGHGLIVTANTFSIDVPNNSKFARILGIDETASWNANLTSSLNILRPEHPIFRNVSTPYDITPAKLTTIPNEWWTEDALVGAEYAALGKFNESAIVTYRGLVYSSVAIESYASRNDLQLFYNIITWSHYERPQDDLIVGLETLPYALPNSSIRLNASVSNIGTNNETNVELMILINDNVSDNTIIPELTSNATRAMSYLWANLQRGTFNITVYAQPTANETNLLNNKITRFVTVADPIIRPVEEQWSNYTLVTTAGNASFTELVNFTYYHYVSPYEINVTYWHFSSGNEWMKSSIVNIITRLVERGTWQGTWFPGWIETNITLGSKVRVLSGVGTVVGSRKITVNNQTLECWNVSADFPYQNYTFYYEKFSGLLAGYDRITILFKEELTLLSTNIPLGRLIKPKINDYAVYAISYFDNSDVTAYGTMTLSYIEFTDARRVKVQVIYSLFDTDDQLIENFTGSILVNIQTRIVEEGPAESNGTYYFSWIETNIGLGSAVVICNRTGTVVGSVIYSVGQRVFDSWLIYVANETQLCLCEYDKASGLLIRATESSLSNPSRNVTLVLLQTNVDVTPPTISIKKPTDNAFINSTETEVQWAGSDNETGIDHYEIYLNSVRVAYVGDSFSTYLLTQITDGTYTIRVEAYDLAGNEKSFEVSIVVDVTLPVAQIFAPNDKSYLRGTVEIDLGGNDTWFDYMELSINDAFKTIYLFRGNYTYSWDTTMYDDGTYNIVLQAADMAGNTAIDRTVVVVDNTVPEVQTLQTEEYVRDVSSIFVYAYDKNLDNVSLYVNDQLVDVWRSNGLHTTLWNTTAFLEGNVTLKVKTFDKAGSSVEQFVQVIVDNIRPTAEIVSPENGTNISGNVGIHLTVFDDNLESAKLTLDGGNFVGVDAVSYYEWITDQVSDGQHILKLEVLDKAGNYQTDIVLVTVDNTKPIVSILSPRDDITVSANVSVIFMVMDQNLGTAVLFLNETSFDVTNATELAIDTKTFQDGTYEVKLVALDYAGNQNEAAITIVIDNTNPTAIITSPANDTELLGIAHINFTSSDEHLTNIFLYIDDEVFNVAKQSFFLWNTTRVGDGIHAISILAVDSAGNVAEDQITVYTVNVQRAAEDRYVAGRNLGVLLGILLTTITVIVTVIAIKYWPSHHFPRDSKA